MSATAGALDLVLRGRNVVLPKGIAPASIHVAGGRIVRIGGFDDLPAGVPSIDAADHFVLPGLVDAHVHVNEPGRTDWEGFETATRAAIAGGVTTLVDMPLNSIPPTTTVAALETKRAAARERIHCDVAFWAGAVPENADDRADLAAAGVCGFKAFLVESGVPEFGSLSPAELETALRQLAALGALLIVHAELPGPIERARAQAAKLAAADPTAEHRRRYATYLASRPPAAEVEAIELLIRLVRESGASAHIVHLSAAEALEPIARAQRDGLPLTAETCPHYLCLASEEIADGATLCKCAPPIRDGANRERLWAGLAAGAVSLVASDHSPSPPEGKDLERGDFDRAWGGIASLGLGLPLLWHEAKRRGHGPEDLVRWMAEEPARLCGLEDRKGSITVGRDADFAVFDPLPSWRVEPSALHTRHRITPYAGRTLEGRVRTTVLRGRIVYQGGTPEPAPHGTLLERRRAPAAVTRRP
ncbi:MAG: allantoinase AllB [Candidatus Eiseniibacteriota bacterium]